MPMVLGLVGVLVVVAIVGMLMFKDDSTVDQGPSISSGPGSASAKPSNLEDDTTGASAKKPAVVDSGPQNAYDRARNANYDMAVLKPLMSKVDMAKWQQIDTYISDAYALKADAEKVRAEGHEDKFKELATQAIDTWRKGDRLYEDFIFEVGGIHRDLWDACFQKEERRYANSAKAMRSYIPYETKRR